MKQNEKIATQSLLDKKQYQLENPQHVRIGGLRKDRTVMPDFILPEEKEQMDGKLRKVMPNSSTIKSTYKRFADKNIIAERTIAKPNKKRYKMKAVYRAAWKDNLFGGEDGI